MSVCVGFHVCDTLYISMPSLGLTGCLWPRAVRPEPGTVRVCVCAQQGTVFRHWELWFHNELLCAVELWSCEAARCGTEEHCVLLNMAQQRGLTDPGWEAPQGKHLRDTSVCLSVCLSVRLSVCLSVRPSVLF